MSSLEYDNNLAFLQLEALFVTVSGQGIQNIHKSTTKQGLDTGPDHYARAA